jgi:tRNA A-37 threonylcarbamoyl transferase component Bud32/membrane-associated phospholipid phosphatase
MSTDDQLAAPSVEPSPAASSATEPPPDPRRLVSPAPGGARPQPTVTGSKVQRARRRRRPTGAPPPLPRSIGRTGQGWLVASVVLLLWLIVEYVSDSARRVTDRVDAAMLRQIASLRTGWLTSVMSGISRVGWGWTMSIVATGLILALLVLKRWRHLFTFVGSFMVLEWIGGSLYDHFQRPRPYDVTVIDRWAGFTLPAPPVALVAIVAVGIVYGLVVPGRSRVIAKAVAGFAILVLAVSELYLATFHPSDVLVGVALAVAVTLNAFRIFTPNDVFPVTYRRGKTAHLDVGGRRGEALRQAVQDQLGLHVVEIKPVGLEGSGGSTPLRIRVAGDPDSYLFGKLYAMSHVRADRWYKVGRTILYGRLEDEAPFQSVRRLVEYEDYAARLLRDIGIPTAAPVGIVEMTPEREYLLVTEFFDDAQEIGDAVVDDTVIDEALAIVRRLWDAGLAHRDVKPANLLVRDGHVLLIDVFFVQVRPSPWRQAVDLANMMLVLGVRSDPQRVYERALQFFTRDEIAEAFAAARGIASPTQLRAALKRDGRDLRRQFRALGPERRPIALQRWSFKRVGLALALVAGTLLAVGATGSLFKPTYDIDMGGRPDCGTGNAMIVMAQAVPSATSVPCIASLPTGWKLAGIKVRRDQGRFWLDSQQGGAHAVEATLLPPSGCTLADASEVPSDEAGMRRFERPEQLPPHLRTTRYYLFSGGCVTYRFALEGPASASLIFDADTALAFEPRSELVKKVRQDSGLRLCGAGAACPGGS